MEGGSRGPFREEVGWLCIAWDKMYMAHKGRFLSITHHIKSYHLSLLHLVPNARLKYTHTKTRNPPDSLIACLQGSKFHAAFCDSVWLYARLKL